MANKVYILQYLRKGLINNLKNGKVAEDAKRAQIDINLRFQVKNANSNKMGKKDFPGQKIELLGPADVKNVSVKAISRVSPAESGDVRLNASYRPYMEFYEEDLPWRYTPFAPGSNGFYPWMRLIAVKDEECTIAFKSGVKVARIRLTEERIKEVFATNDELAKSAHVQIDVDDNFKGTLDEATVNKLLDENPDCGISRVLCPSVLEAATEYKLLLIPTYELGRLSALGLSTDGVKMNTLVTPQPDTQLEVPIYYKWRCTTATQKGTFKDLADELNFTPAADYNKMEANLTVDISHSGLKTVSFTDEKKIDVPAALVMGTDPYSKLDDEGNDYRKKLMEHLALNPVFDENELGEVNQEEDPWVVPPVYGARHLLTTRKDFEKGPDAGVVNEVNQKLHNRIAAGMGGTVVMNNQEEFVNRAWKSVEVINALNQMLREYYQMNQVNECAKDKNVRSSINTKALNNQNEGLISDAALRMLQTSGIYYNNVAPDTMLNEYMQMEVKKDSGDQSSGLSKDYLAGLYDKEVWNNIIADDYRFDHVSDMFKNDAAWGETGLSDVDFLSEYFRTTVVDTNKARFIPVEDAVGKMNVSPSSLVMSDVWPSIQSILLEDPKEIDMSSIYSMIKGLKVEYETFNENRLSNYSKLGANKNTQTSASVRPYPIHVINPFGPTFIVPDSCYNTLTINGTQVGNRPIAVQYYSSKSAKNPLYFFIVPKSFLDTLQPQYYMRYKGINIPLLVDSQGNYSLKTGFSSIGATIYTAELAASRPDASPLWNQLVSNLHWMTDRNFILYVDKPKSGKDYKSPDKPKFHQKLYVDKVQTSIDNTKTFKYKWLTWKFDGTADKFNTFVLEKKRWNLSIPSYRNLIMEVVNYLVDVQKLMYQPTDVEISLPSTDPRCIVISPQDYFKPLYEEAKKNLEINLSENPELALIQQEVDRQRARIDDLLKLMPKPSNSQNAGAPSIDVIDPDQLAKDRIKAIEEQYGVTEFNQLEDRLRDKYPVMIHPDFLDPTYFYLRELSIDYVLPASDSLAKNSISCFYSNQAFEEAFLLGMNTEMGRELMWREYPTDQRGSYFRKFWDQTELPKKEELKSKYYDIEDIDKWKGKLGNNHRAGKLPMLVFAIKGKLMQTYPDTDVYLQKIGAGGKPASEVKKQDMASWLTSDTYLVGFSGIKKEDLKNYYLVFQQKPLSLQFSKQAENQNNPYGIVNPQCYLLAAAQ